MNCCIIIIHTLNKFKYDDKLITEQLANGIIPVLIGKLTWLVGPPDVVNFKHPSEKRRKYTFSNSGIVKKRLRCPDVSTYKASFSAKYIQNYWKLLSVGASGFFWGILYHIFWRKDAVCYGS